MEDLLRKRKPLRQSFTVAASKLEAEILKADVDSVQLNVMNLQLELKYNKLNEVQSEISDMLCKADDESEYVADFETNETYQDKYISLKARVEKKISNFLSEVTPGILEISKKRNFKLPKLELPKFNGETRNWLGFWGQFRKIDEDTNIDDDDKFQYLLQATVVGSPARELIDSYPPSGANYKDAVKQLKSRFARDELLVEIYVRELLKLVLTQAAKDGDMTISTLYDKLETQLRALDTLGVKSEIYAAMLYPLVESTLPEEILRAWERSRHRTGSSKHTENLEKLLDFLRIEVESEERLQLARTGFPVTEKVGSVPATAACIYAGDSKKRQIYPCIWCDKNTHNSSECFKLHNLSLEDKKSLLKKKRACFQCLKTGHGAERCNSSAKCLICRKQHVMVMCPELKGPLGLKREQHKIPIETTEALLSNQKSHTTLLQTIMVKIVHKGKKKTVRALFDNGSQRSYLRKDIIQKLGLNPVDHETLSHNLFGGVETDFQSHGIFDVEIQSMEGKFRYGMSVLDKDRICGYIPRVEFKRLRTLRQTHKIGINDFGKNTPDIGLLIGADYSGQLMMNNIVPIDKNLIAIETKLGWTLQGPVKFQTTVSDTVVSCHLDLTELWNLETIGIRDPTEVKTKEKLDIETVKFFQENIKSVEKNWYEVCLPWKDSHRALRDDNKAKAEKRLISNSRRFLKMGYFEKYDEIIKEWQEEGIIENAPYNSASSHYLAHQAVIKNSSLTTKVRPIFDSSLKGEKGNSLNAFPEKGPNLVEVISKLLRQFRQHAIGVTADVKRAFLQISLSDEDRDFLKFLWWKDTICKEIITYRHCRVALGLSSSPFLMAATIAHHLENAPQELKETSIRLKRSFYVDNCVAGFETEREVATFEKESRTLMSSGGFDLRGWIADPCENQPFESSSMTSNQKIISILGLSRDTDSDESHCNMFNLTFSESIHSKRLSVTQRIFDSIAFTSPTTLIPKLVLQKTSKIKLSGDENLPQCIEKEFKVGLKRVHFLNYCKILRRLVSGRFEKCSSTVHAFSDDTSKVSYAACVFLRVSFEGNTLVQLALFKSRVDPAKVVNIPRLELHGALIATRLYRQVTDALKLANCKAYFWSDSSVGLTWIKKDSNWSDFVTNRAVEIRECSNPEDWYYVPSSLNPADLPSGGYDAKPLLQSKWWEGTDWLKHEANEWPTCEVSEVDEKTVESKITKNVISSISCMIQNFVETFTRFSSYYKNIRILAWIFRFLNNSRRMETTKRENLNELDWEKIMEFSTIENIKWKFHPPTAAWWERFWERLGTMVKELLRRMLGSKTISYIELGTVLCDCEATKNSRPLTYLEDETSELKPLPPAYFIQGILRNEIKDLDITDSNSLNRRLRYLQKLRDDLRTRLRNEYLSLLDDRERNEDILQLGDVVFNGTPEKRINWSLGLVVQVFPGTYGHIIVAKVKRIKREKIRPVHNLYPLEVARPADLPSHCPSQEVSNPDQVTVPEKSFPLKEAMGLKTDASKRVEALSKSFEPNKPITTRSGRRVKLPYRQDL